MASNYPASKQTFTNPLGTQTLDSPDHATGHTTTYDTLGSIQDTVGTNSGTNILMGFVAGQFPIRATGSGATGTLQQTIVSGTLNSFTAGTPAITGGTWSSLTANNATFGTPAITGGTANNTTQGTTTVAGTIILPSTVIPTGALVNNAVSIGTLLFNVAPADGTITGAFANIGGVSGTVAITVASDIFASLWVTSYNSAATGVNMNFRLQGTAAAGTFNVPNANGIEIRHPTNNERKGVGITGYIAGISVGTYICAIQGSTSAGSLIVDPNDWLSASVLQLRK